MEFIAKVKKRPWIHLFIIFFVSLFFYATLSTMIGWRPISTDTVNIGWGIEKLEETGQLQPFWIGGSGYHPNVEKSTVYPAIQRLVVFLTPARWGGIMAYQIVILFVAALIPVGVFLIIQLWIEDRLFGYASVLLTWGSFSLLSSYFVTPQNHFGFLTIVFGSWFMMRFLRHRLWKDIAGIAVMLFLTALFHQLSGFVFGIIVAMMVTREMYIRYNGYVAFVFVFAAIIILTWLVGGWGNPLKILVELIAPFTFIAGEPGPIYKNVWELPVPLGYFLTLLVFIGIFSDQKEHLPRELVIFLGIYVLPVLILSQLHLMGFYYIIPNRFVMYLWLPFVLTAVYGLRILYKEFLAPQRKIFRGVAIIIFIMTALLPAVNAARAYPPSYGKMVHLTDDHRESFEWLKNQAKDDENILTATYSDREKILYLPFYINSKITRYENYNYSVQPTLLARDKFMRLSRLGEILYYFWPDILRGTVSKYSSSVKEQMNIYFMITEPDSPRARALFKEYKITYIWLERDMIENTFLRDQEFFRPVFENNTIIIYGIY